MNSVVDRKIIIFSMVFMNLELKILFLVISSLLKYSFVLFRSPPPHKTIVDIQEGWDEMFTKSKLSQWQNITSGVLLDNLQSHSMEMPSSQLDSPMRKLNL